MTLFQFWRAHTAEFGALLGQHVLLVALSTAIAIVAGVPIGILAARRPRLGAPIVWLANIVQTIPSLAMFGFLLPLPLVGGLGARVAIFVLILYALLPIIRTTTAGLQFARPCHRRGGHRDGNDAVAAAPRSTAAARACRRSSPESAWRR